MGINKKNKNTTFEKYRIDNLTKQLGKIKEDAVLVQTNKKKNNQEGNELSEIAPLIQLNSRELDKWTTYLAYLLKQEINSNKNKNNKKTKTTQTVCKYEALLTQCSYLSRMAYTPAEVFCRMTQFLDLTPNAFNDYIRVIEKIMGNKVKDKMINYECSYNSLWLMKQASYQSLFKVPNPEIKAEQATDNNITPTKKKNETK
jgi:hypothetical protein